MKNSIERRFNAGELRVDESTGKKTIRGYAAKYNSLSNDLGGFREMLAPGCFAGCMTDDVRGLLNHDPSLILGRTKAGTMRISDTPDGLVYEIDLPDTTLANDLAVSMTRGDIDQSSFAFSLDYEDPNADEWTWSEDAGMIRTVRKVASLFDCSPVTYPAYESSTSAVYQRALFPNGVPTEITAKLTPPAPNVEVDSRNAQAHLDIRIRLAEAE
jgi:HK97 family phage prohead protease